MSIADQAIWHIEMRLAEPCNLDDLADACGVTTFHLGRAFRAATGLTPISYQRARRLAFAAERLKVADSDILNIALEAQYNSHEAFTRAFQSQFQMSPSLVGPETQLNLMEPIKMDERRLVEINPPDIKTIDTKRIIGLSLACSQDNIASIPDLWRRMAERIQDIPAQSGNAYGVCYNGDGKGNFHYLAGMDVASNAVLPDGMESVDLPAGSHAVFTFEGNITDFQSFVYSIWNKALPESGYKHRWAPDFELYDGRFNVAEGAGIIEVWIPVANG